MFTTSEPSVVTISKIPVITTSNRMIDESFYPPNQYQVAPVKSISPPLMVKSPPIVTSFGKPI